MDFGVVYADSELLNRHHSRSNSQVSQAWRLRFLAFGAISPRVALQCPSVESIAPHWQGWEASLRRTPQ